MVLRVAGAQMPVTEDIEANRKAVERAVAFAARNRADILLTPEGSVSGYTARFDDARLEDALGAIVETARTQGLALALGTCRREEDGLCYNELRFYDASGAFLGFHAKILRCGDLRDPANGEITAYAAAPLRTFTVKGVICGGLICNDMWANPECTPVDDPHLSQKLSQMGARVIFHAVNGGRDGSEYSRVTVWNYHESNLRMRARAGGLFIVTCDSAFPKHLPCSAPSGVVSPEGRWLLETAAQGERHFVHELRLEVEAAEVSRPLERG